MKPKGKNTTAAPPDTSLPRLATLAAISREIAASEDLPVLFQRILRAALRETQSPCGLVGVLSDARDSIQIASQVRWELGNSRSPTMALPGNPLAQALRRGKLSSGTLAHLPNDSDRKKPQAQLFLAAPLVIEGNPRGILAVARKACLYSKAEKKMLQTLAALAAVCLERDCLRQALEAGGKRATRRGLPPEVLEKLRLTNMGDVAATIAHELRQPLSAIQLLASYLKATVTSADRKVSRNLKLLEQQAEMAGQILSNLVSFARSGRPRKTAADLHQTLKSVLQRISWRPEIRLKRNLGRRLPPVCADPLHLDRIISNLVTNGLESMEGPGTLSIATRAERENVLLQITDTGCGIHPSDAGKIFQPFVTTKRTGTGLGLALCRQLAEANGGSILFQSRHGQGTTFELRLPRSV